MPKVGLKDKRTFGGRNYFAYGRVHTTKREAQREAAHHRDHAYVRVVRVRDGYRLYLNTK